MGIGASEEAGLEYFSRLWANSLARLVLFSRGHAVQTVLDVWGGGGGVGEKGEGHQLICVPCKLHAIKLIFVLFSHLPLPLKPNWNFPYLLKFFHQMLPWILVIFIYI